MFDPSPFRLSVEESSTSSQFCSGRNPGDVLPVFEVVYSSEITINILIKEDIEFESLYYKKYLIQV